MGSSYNFCHEIIREVPQGFLNDLFFFISNSNVCNFEKDTLHSVDKNFENTTSELKNDLIGAWDWLKMKSLKANPEVSGYFSWKRVLGNYINNVKNR